MEYLSLLETRKRL